MQDFAPRLRHYAKWHAQLAALSDAALRDWLTSAAPVSGSFSGRVALLTDGAEQLLVKRIALTAVEREPAHYLATQNYFHLPLCYHYAIGSRGFGAWRELVAQQMASEWVLSQQCPHFPLLYHWRVLPRADGDSPVLSEQQLAQECAFWQDEIAIEQRLRALQQADAEIYLFLEYVPYSLMQWLKQQAGRNQLTAPLLNVETQLRQVTHFMQAQGFIHFDAHFENILTDGEQLYFSDFGLANSLQFDLSPEERAFMQQHEHYDFYFVMLNLMHVLTNPHFDEERRWTQLSKQALSPELLQLPVVQALIRDYWQAAVVMDQFFDQLFNHTRHAVYPAAELVRLSSALQRPSQ